MTPNFAKREISAWSPIGLAPKRKLARNVPLCFGAFVLWGESADLQT
jgi:hypothetical protein